VPWQGATPGTWPALRDRLAAERTAAPHEPWSAGVRVTMREPRSGRVFDGRGGIAVAPGRALRMILVGGAGTTLLDAWVTRARWRVAVPPLHLVRRGGADEPRDLPVGFLRWWFFTPLEGQLFAASDAPPGPTWLLRDGAAVVELRVGTCDRGELRTASRRVGGRTERVEECRERAVPRPGDWVRYRDEASGLGVDLVVESVRGSLPDEEAFRDPDSSGAAP